MKTRIISISLILISVSFWNNILGQCTDQVTHVLGTSNINGIEIIAIPSDGIYFTQAGSSSLLVKDMRIAE